MHSLLHKAVTWTPFACAAAVMGVALIRLWVSPRRATRCIGRDLPDPAARRAWSVLKLLPRARCGYDLATLRPGTDGKVCCPECGCRTLQSDMARCWLPLPRAMVLASLLCLCVYLPDAFRWVRDGRWAASTPSIALIFIREGLGDHAPVLVRSELVARVVDGSLSSHLPWATELLVQELRNDAILANAAEARRGLRAAGVVARPALERALLSPDYQQRQLAADILRAGLGAGDDEPPSAECLRVTIEGLGRAPLNADGEESRDFRIQSEGDAFLAVELRAGGDRAELAARLIREAIATNADFQLEFTLSSIAASVGAGPHAVEVEKLTGVAIPVLVAHLANNGEFGDARQTVASLLELGDRCIPALQDAMLSDDAQQRRLAALICRRITDPGAPAVRLAKDDPAKISQVAFDPTVLPREHAERP